MIIKNVEFTPVFLTWTNKQSWIYTIRPLDETIIQKHPVYKRYSLITDRELTLFDSLMGDFELDERGNYKLKALYWTIPNTVDEQWGLFEKRASFKNARRLFQKLKKEPELRESLIIDSLINGTLVNHPIVQALATPSELRKLEDLANELTSSSQLLVFMNELPESVLELLTEAELTKLATIDSLGAKHSAKAFLKDPWLAIDLEGFGFKKVDKLREKLFSALGDSNPVYSPDNDKRLYYGAYSAIKELVLQKGDTYTTIEAFKEKLVKDLELPFKRVEEFCSAYEGLTVQLKLNRRFVLRFLENGFITTEDLFKAEQLIHEELKNNTAVRPLKDYELKKQLFFDQEELSLSEEQKAVFSAVNNNRFSMIIGGGGTGKTYTVSQLIRFLQGQGYGVELLAPTGKAAKVLSNYSNSSTRTIHSRLSLINSGNGRLVSQLKEKLTADFVIIDEFSMVDSELFAKVLNAYPSKTRFLLVGDESQLPSVSPGNLLHLFIKHKLVETVRLTKVFRVNPDSNGIATISEQFRNGRFTLTNNDGEFYAFSKDLYGQHTDDPVLIAARIIQTYTKLLKEKGLDPIDVMVLTPKNKGELGQLALNTLIQPLVQSHKELFFIEEDGFPLKNKQNLYPQDLVMVLDNRNYFVSYNDYSLLKNRIDPQAVGEDNPSVIQLTNGDLATVLSFNQDGVSLELPDKRTAFIPTAMAVETLTLGYAYTIHKSQGSEAKAGIIVVTGADAYQLNANLLYTGVSRFKEFLFLYGNHNTIRQSVRRFANKERKTLLELFVLGVINNHSAPVEDDSITLEKLIEKTTERKSKTNKKTTGEVYGIGQDGLYF